MLKSIFKPLREKFTKVEFHIEETTRFNTIYEKGSYSPSYTKLEPSITYNIIMEVTQFFFFKKKTPFEDTFFCRHVQPPVFKTEEHAREVIEEVLLKGKYPGMTLKRIVPPSYTFKNIEDNV